MSDTQPLEPGKHYHIYNRGNNRQDVFIEERNYTYFLKLYAHHIEPIAETYAYCLMRNHFHLLVRIRDLADLPGLQDLEGLGRRASRAFSNLFNAYAKAINKAHARTGSLFQKNFSRIEVTSDGYFMRLVTYIHQNPQKHGFVADFREWPHSSYQTLLSAQPTRLRRDAVLGWFGGREEFTAIHRQGVEERLIEPLIGEDFD